MYARLGWLEDGDAEQIGQLVNGLKGFEESGPPPGLPATGLLVLHNVDEGKMVTVLLFDSEETMRHGDEALQAMEPPVPYRPDQRTGVDFYEVGVKVDAPAH
jgi:hypothetical protein